MTIVGTQISMTRGDSESLTVSCLKDGELVPLVAGDTVYFTVKTSTETEEKLLQKVVTAFTDGKAIVEIDPNDTRSLSYGKYIYDVQLTKASGAVITIVRPSKFILLDEVTYE